MLIESYGQFKHLLKKGKTTKKDVFQKICAQCKVTVDIKEKALKWFESYLSDHRQAVVVNAKTSSWHSSPFGVPQGSVLLPILFTMYISPLGDLVRQHNVSYHMYADDTQLYLSFQSNDHESVEVAKSSIEQCVLVIKKWMASNFLKLNDDKTEDVLLLLLLLVVPQLSISCEY